MSETPARVEVIESFRKQVGWCERLNSPFTARLLQAASGDLEHGGPLADLIGEWPGDPVADALPLRVAGALHALALAGRDPDLAALYPPATADPDAQELWNPAAAAIATHRAFVVDWLTSPPQTNEVGRSAVLLGGFLEIASQTGRPLRLLEIGASAGLNLAWDRYHYRLGDAVWGDPTSLVSLAPNWSGPLPVPDTQVQIAERLACDRAPIRLDDPDQRLRLRAFVWADQRERLVLLENAMTVAQDLPVAVETADAAVWLEARLKEPAPGVATVVYHSVVWQYLALETQARATAAITAAGAAATPDAPVAWLRFELLADGQAPELYLDLWPDGETRRLARAHPHGAMVQWLDGQP